MISGCANSEDCDGTSFPTKGTANFNLDGGNSGSNDYAKFAANQMNQQASYSGAVCVS